MAKNSAQRAAGPARVRFIMVEAEMPNGDLTQITQAIQNALRPAPGATPPRAIGQIAQPAPAVAEIVGPEHVDGELGEVGDLDAVGERTPRTRNSAPRKHHRMPKVLHDADLNAEPCLESLVQEKKPNSDLQKFLVTAYWWKQARNVEAITLDHVHTCYVALKWSPSTEDFSQPFRTLKNKGVLEQKGRGLYTINKIGIDRVEKMGK